jgi:hypothetical protein
MEYHGGNVKEVGDWILNGNETLKLSCDLRHFMILTIRQTGCSAFSARLLNPL